MTRRAMFGLTLGVMVLIVLASVPASAEEPIARVSYAGSQLSFEPLIEGTRLVLTVSGPAGFYVSREFPAGAAASLAVVGTDGAPLVDGSYTFELQAVPVLKPELRAALAEARRSGDYSQVAKLRGESSLPQRPMVHTGYFRIASGSLVTPGESPAQEEVPLPAKETGSGQLTKDQCTYDDEVIDGSLCVGNDCTCPYPSFGYDTIVLAENNLRIYFDDTSTIAGYPSNDWRIIINDSTSSGISYFGVQDATEVSTPFRIEAGAPDSSLYVEDLGRVGFGTSTPYVELHVKDGDSPTLRLEQDGSFGFTPQTWDITSNETNFFIRDATGGSKLPFRIQPGSPTSSITIRDTGYVGIGTWSPAKKLDISDSGPTMRFTNTGSGGGIWDLYVNSNTGRLNYTDDSDHTRVPFKFDPGADNNLFRVGVVSSDQIDIDGDLVVSGTITPDYVFNPDFELESIEEHAETMWKNRHLPAIGPATLAEDGTHHQINVGQRAEGVLEELEKAHIYIEQLNTKIKELERKLEELAAASE